MQIETTLDGLGRDATAVTVTVSVLTGGESDGELDLAVADALTAMADRLMRHTPGPPVQQPVDGLEIAHLARRVSVCGSPIGLTYMEFELLRYLIANSGRALGRDELLRNVWDLPVVATASRTVDVHIRRLRMKLGPVARHITTVRNVGYGFDERA